MPQLTKNDQNLADLAFIVGELNRFAAMEPKEVIQHMRSHREDAFATLRGARSGVVFCGRAAYARFEAIADRTIKTGSTEAKTFDRRNYIRALRDAFAEIFIAGAKHVKLGTMAQFLNRACELATKDLVDFTHHLPCVVFSEQEPDTFVIGPVVFTVTQRFLTELEPEMQKYQESNEEAFAEGLQKRKPELPIERVKAEAEAFARRHIDLIRSYYAEFDWVASVRIPAAHAGISQLRAGRAVDAALDVLRLFVPTFPERYRRADAPNAPFETRELMTDSTGKLISAMRQGGRGAPSIEGWYEHVRSDTPDLWDEFERAVGTLTKGDTLDDLTQRLVDALYWFGQAVVDENPAAAIVKYTAGLERLTITGHIAKGLEAMVIRRVAYLNNDRVDKTPNEITTDIGGLYQMRSDLMHGSISPYHQTVPQALRIGWEVGRWGVLRAALVFRSLRLSGKTTRKDLAAHYEQGVAPTPPEPADP